MFPFEESFHPGKQTTTKSHLERDPVNEEGRARGFYVFYGQKLLNTQHGVGKYAGKSLIMKWANALKVSKISLEAKCSLS